MYVFDMNHTCYCVCSPRFSQHTSRPPHFLTERKNRSFPVSSDDKGLTTYIHNTHCVLDLFYTCDRAFDMNRTCYCVRSPRFRQHTSRPPHFFNEKTGGSPCQTLDHTYCVLENNLKGLFYACDRDFDMHHTPHYARLFSAFSETYHLVPRPPHSHWTVVHSVCSNRE